MAKETEEEAQAAPTKAPKTGMKLPVIIGIIAGVVVVQAIIIVLFINFFITPSIPENDSKSKNEKVEKAAKDEKSEEFDVENLKFVETGRVTTNPKMSTKFVVINLGLEFIPNEESESGKEESLPPRMIAKIKGVMNQLLGSYLVEELHAKRDSLGIMFKSQLKSTFSAEHLVLKDVIVQEFIIQ